MRLTPDHPDFENILVFLDNKLCKSYLSADDEEGWIDIPDIKKMAPIDLEDNTKADPVNLEKEEEIEVWDEVPTVRKTGKVEFRHIITDFFSKKEDKG